MQLCCWKRKSAWKLFKKNSRVYFWILLFEKSRHLHGCQLVINMCSGNMHLQNTACERAITQVTSCFLTPLQTRWRFSRGSSSWGKCFNATRLIHTANWSTAKDQTRILNIIYSVHKSTQDSELDHGIKCIGPLIYRSRYHGWIC